MFIPPGGYRYFPSQDSSAHPTYLMSTQYPSFKVKSKPIILISTKSSSAISSASNSWIDKLRRKIFRHRQLRLLWSYFAEFEPLLYRLNRQILSFSSGPVVSNNMTFKLYSPYNFDWKCWFNGWCPNFIIFINILHAISRNPKRIGGRVQRRKWSSGQKHLKSSDSAKSDVKSGGYLL